VFDTLRRSGAGALVISADPVFTAKSEQLAALTLQHKLPAVHESRRFAAAGGLLIFSGNTLESHRLAGIYAGTGRYVAKDMFDAGGGFHPWRGCREGGLCGHLLP
jgi:hypothetical protein